MFQFELNLFVNLVLCYNIATVSAVWPTFGVSIYDVTAIAYLESDEVCKYHNYYDGISLTSYRFADYDRPQ